MPDETEQPPVEVVNDDPLPPDEPVPTLGDCAGCGKPVSPFEGSCEDAEGVWHVPCYDER